MRTIRCELSLRHLSIIVVAMMMVLAAFMTLPRLMPLIGDLAASLDRDPVTIPIAIAPVATAIVVCLVPAGDCPGNTPP